MNSQIFKYFLIIIVFFYLGGCYPTIYGIPQEYWGTLTEDQKRTAIEGYYERERLRVLQDSLWQIERERQHAEQARWRVEEAERRASEAEQRARDAEQKLREEKQSNENNHRPSKQLGHGKVTK